MIDITRFFTFSVWPVSLSVMFQIHVSWSKDMSLPTVSLVLEAYFWFGVSKGGSTVNDAQSFQPLNHTVTSKTSQLLTAPPFHW